MGKLSNVGLAHVLEEMVSRVVTLGGKPKRPATVGGRGSNQGSV